MDDATSILELPDDPVALKQLLVRERADRVEQLAHREAVIEQIKREAAERIEAIQRDSSQHLESIKHSFSEQVAAIELKHKAEMDAVLRRFYGPKSEKFDPRQLLIFGLAVAEQIPVDQSVVEAESGQKLVTHRINHHKHGRRKLPEHLPRIDVHHDLSDAEKLCPCCNQPRAKFGGETSEQLEYIPASFKVLRHIRSKYACKTCGEGCVTCDCNPHIDIATKTPREGEASTQPIEKGLPGPGLLAYVIVSNSAITCRCTAWSTSSPATMWTSRAPRCARGCSRPVNWSNCWWS